MSPLLIGLRSAMAALVLIGALPVLLSLPDQPFFRFVWLLALLEVIGAILLPVPRFAAGAAWLLLSVYLVALAVHLHLGRSWIPFGYAAIAFALMLIIESLRKGHERERTSS